MNFYETHYIHYLSALIKSSINLDIGFTCLYFIVDCITFEH